MAELNVFRTIPHEILDSSQTVYTAPATYTGIVLSTQVTNASDSTETLTMTYADSAGGVDTELLSQFAIPARDTLSATTGKMVVQANGVLKMTGSSSGKLKAIVSILESLNG
jgi:hypothetical protein